MHDPADPSTNTTLLARLSQTPSNELAWDEFVDRYGRLIYGWFRRWGLQEADAEDVAQAMLLALARQMRAFVYDPSRSFRGWLRTIARRTWGRFIADRQRWPVEIAPADADRLCSQEAETDFLQQLEAEGEAELLELAQRAARGRVSPRVWEAFRLSTEEDLSGAEVARLLDIKPGAVYVATGRVRKIIREEFERLGGDPEA